MTPDLRPVADVHGSLVVESITPALRRRVWNLSGKTATCFLLRRGEANLQLGERMQTAQAPGVLWLAVKSEARLEISAGAEGAILLVPAALIYRCMPFGSIANELLKVTNMTQVHAELDAARATALSASVEAMFAEIRLNQPGMPGVLEAHLRVLIISLWRLMRSGEAPESGPRDIAQRFRTESVLRLRDQPSVTEMARTLGVSCDQLNRAVLRAFQMTPKQLIHSLILTEARGLLTESNLQVDQIAVLLGFSDPGYFNRFFSQRAGLSPGQFRKTSTNEPRPETTTFAAWP